MFEKNINYYVGVSECKIAIKTGSSGKYQFDLSITGRSYEEVKPQIDKGTWELTELVNSYNKQVEEKKTQTKLTPKK